MPIREFRCENGHLSERLLPSHVNHEVNQTMPGLKAARDMIIEFSGQENSREHVCPICSAALHPILSLFSTPNDAIHASERPVVLRNHRTGEVRYLANRDMPVDAKYAARGFVKEEAFTSFAERDAFEKSTGRIHERSHYDPGSNTAEKDLTPPDPAANLEKFRLSRVPARI